MAFSPVTLRIRVFVSIVSSLTAQQNGCTTQRSWSKTILSFRPIFPDRGAPLFSCLCVRYLPTYSWFSVFFFILSFTMKSFWVVIGKEGRVPKPPTSTGECQSIFLGPGYHLWLRHFVYDPGGTFKPLDAKQSIGMMISHSANFLSPGTLARDLAWEEQMNLKCSFLPPLFSYQCWGHWPPWMCHSKPLGVRRADKSSKTFSGTEGLDHYPSL